MKRIIFPILMLLLSMDQGLPAEKRRLTLKECVGLALERYPEIKAAEASVESAAYYRRSAKSLFFPSLSTSFSYLRYDQAPYYEIDFEFPEEYQELMEQFGLEMKEGEPMRLETGSIDNYAWTVTLKQPIFTGLTLKNTYAAARASERSERATLEGKKNDLVNNVEKTFFSLKKAEMTVRMMKESIELAKAHLKDLRQMAEVGMAIKTDLLKAGTQLDQLRLSLFKAENAREVIKVSLYTLTGIPLDEEVEFDFDAEVELPFELKGMEFMDLREAAVSSRPELKAMREGIEALKLTARAVKGTFFPSLYGVLDFYYKNPDRSLEPNWYASGDFILLLQWTIFDSGATYHKYRKSMAEVRKLEEACNSLIKGVELELKSNLMALIEAERGLLLSKKGVESARENYRVSLEKWREGLLSSSELLDAEKGLTNAMAQEINYLCDIEIAKSNIKKAVGKGGEW